MPKVHAHLFNFAFTIHLSAYGRMAGKRRAAMRWLIDRMPAELVSLTYDARGESIRVEMVSRWEQSDRERNQYIVTLETALWAHLDGVDDAVENEQLSLRRAELAEQMAGIECARPQVEGASTIASEEGAVAEIQP